MDYATGKPRTVDEQATWFDDGITLTDVQCVQGQPTLRAVYDGTEEAGLAHPKGLTSNR